MKAEHGNGNGHGNSLHVEALRLMPTTRDGKGRNQRDDATCLTGALLPTPSAASPDSRRARHDGGTYSAGGYNRDQLGDVVAQGRWAQYAPAIARWEALTRPAPSPTEPTGKAGAHRLSPAFVEWLMGLPAGWVTDPAIWDGWKPGAARNAQLKALGNGVVPQQGAAALRHLLEVRNAHMTKAVA